PPPLWFAPVARSDTETNLTATSHRQPRGTGMQVDDLILVSVDDHVVEPPDLFEGRLSKKAAERAPRVERLESGREVWMFEGSAMPNVGLNAVAGRVPEEYGVDPVAFDEMRPG